jgi:hypothetical protein
MTPKEKAKELYNKYSVYNVNGKSIMKIGPEVKVFTLITVDEIIKELTEEISPSVHGFRHQYWQEVKHEIEKL